LALPESHFYRAVGDRSYHPQKAPNEAVWELAFPLFAQIIAADPRAHTDERRQLNTRRSALARHLYWLAGDSVDRLDPDYALDETTIERSALLSEGHTTLRSQQAFRSELRSFRGGFPDLFPDRSSAAPSATVEPISDSDFEIVLGATNSFRSLETRNYVRALLLLGRGAGVGGADSRFLTGRHIYRRPHCGLWVQIDRPKARREVPVLARFQDEIESLAHTAGDLLLTGVGAPPAAMHRPNELTDMLVRRLRAQHPALRVSTVRLRKAWQMEVLAGWTDLQVFLAAAGLKSMHGLEDVLRRYPVPAFDPVRDARLLGGIVDSRGDEVWSPRQSRGRD